MPYFQKKVKGGYKVCKKTNPKKCFSKKPLSKRRVKAQMYAMIKNESTGINLQQIINEVLNSTNI